MRLGHRHPLYLIVQKLALSVFKAQLLLQYPDTSELYSNFMFTGNGVLQSILIINQTLQPKLYIPWSTLINHHHHQHSSQVTELLMKKMAEISSPNTVHFPKFCNIKVFNGTSKTKFLVTRMSQWRTVKYCWLLLPPWEVVWPELLTCKEFT